MILNPFMRMIRKSGMKGNSVVGITEDLSGFITVVSKHPPYPPSKEGGVIKYFPLGEGGQGDCFPLGEGGFKGD